MYSSVHNFSFVTNDDSHPMDFETLEPVNYYDKSKSVSFVLFTGGNKLMYDTETKQTDVLQRYKFEYLPIKATANWMRETNRHPVTNEPVKLRYLNKLQVFDEALGKGLRLSEAEGNGLDSYYKQFESDPAKFKLENETSYKSLFTQYANNVKWFDAKDEQAKKFLEQDYTNTLSNGFVKFLANRENFKKENPYLYALLRRDFHIGDSKIVSKLQNKEALEIRSEAIKQLQDKPAGTWLIRKTSVVSHCPLISVRVISIVKPDKELSHRLFGYCIGYGYFGITTDSNYSIDLRGYIKPMASTAAGVSIFHDKWISYCSFLDYLESLADTWKPFELDQLIIFE